MVRDLEELSGVLFVFKSNDVRIVECFLFYVRKWAVSNILSRL